MKISTSYFYQIRNFTPDMIPVSTAKWDPKWYGPIHIDENGVLNGLRIPEFTPGESCENLCQGKNCDKIPESCPFMKAYREQFKKLIFKNVYRRLSVIAEHGRNILGLPYDIEPHIVLMVYEAPSNPCSERAAIQEFFRSNGVECNELQYPIKI